MTIKKVIFAGLLASATLAHANPAVLKNTETNAIESVANMVKPIGKEIAGLTAMPPPSVAVTAVRDSAAAPAAALTNVGMVRNVNIEVDAPIVAASASVPAAPIQENDINMFLLLALLVGAILLRRRAE